MNTNFPPNAIFFYSFITDIAQFNIIPPNWYPIFIQQLTFSATNNPINNFKLMDIF